MSPTTSTRSHGLTGYEYGCRCNTCRRAKKAYRYRRESAIAAGTWQAWVPAERVREHILGLRGSGIGLGQIEALSGVSQKTILNIVNRTDKPQQARVRTSNAKAILAVTTDAAPADGDLIDATGSARRIQALYYLGWTMFNLDREAGLPLGTCAQIAVRHTFVTARNARAVAAMYDRMSMVVAPASRTATRARRLAAARGWAPPLAWDDDRIDNPGAKPRGVLLAAGER